MANILDYLDWRGDLTMTADPFHTVDALILAQLSYLPLDGIVSGEMDDGIPLREAAAAFDPEQADQKQISFCYEQDQMLLQKLGQSASFADIRLTGYISRTDFDGDTQFSALTCILGDQRRFVSFRGTDGSIAGWKEDFNFSFMTETPGQRFAAEYVNRCGEAGDGEILIGGHSKGGNFAVYAATFCQPEMQARIGTIYDFDGPGFRDEIAESDSYMKILPKIVSVIPQSSLVGQLLTSNTAHQIVTSTAAGVAQHIAYTWNVMQNAFVLTEELSKFGVFVNKTVTGWLREMDDESRQATTEAVFDLIAAPEKDTFHEMSKHKIKSVRAILKALRTLAPEEQQALKRAIALLAQQSKKALFPEKQDALPDLEDAEQNVDSE